MTIPARRLILPVALLVAGLALGWGLAQWRMASSSSLASAPAAAASADRKVLYWYDPMVPTQRFDKPGKSPFMDMQLVPRYADEAEPGGSGAGSLAVSTQAQQALGLRLAAVQRR
ncbi:MAG: heavy metal-binding domain-containing protein, partial [Burkholderiales bacterium]